MAPLHRGSQLFAQMRSGGRILEWLLFYKSKHDLRQLASTKADCLRCHGTVMAEQNRTGVMLQALVAETNC